jgi:hypothetical protein
MTLKEKHPEYDLWESKDGKIKPFSWDKFKTGQTYELNMRCLKFNAEANRNSYYTSIPDGTYKAEQLKEVWQYRHYSADDWYTAPKHDHTSYGTFERWANQFTGETETRLTVELIADQPEGKEPICGYDKECDCPGRCVYLINPNVGEKETVQDLKNALWQDKSGMAKALSDIVKWADAYRWILDGRGCYDYDDDRYKDEVKNIITGVTEIASRALSSSGDLVMDVHTGLFTPNEETTLRSLQSSLTEKDAEIERLKGRINIIEQQKKSVSEWWKSASATLKLWKDAIVNHLDESTDEYKKFIQDNDLD